MPYKLDWIVPERVLLGRLWGDLQPEEIRRLAPGIHEEAARGQAPVYVIVDTIRVSHTPISMRELNSFLNRDDDKKTGLFILISENRIARFMGAVIMQLIGLNMRIFNDRPSAFRFLNEIDSTLPDLAAIDIDSQAVPSDT